MTEWRVKHTRRGDYLDDAANFSAERCVTVSLQSEGFSTDLILTGAQVAAMFQTLAALDGE